MSASKDKANRIHITLCNRDPHNGNTVTVDLRGASISRVAGGILTADALNPFNTFDKPDAVEPADLTEARKTEAGLEIQLPAKSVVMLELY